MQLSECIHEFGIVFYMSSIFLPLPHVTTFLYIRELMYSVNSTLHIAGLWVINLNFCNIIFG